MEKPVKSSCHEEYAEHSLLAYALIIQSLVLKMRLRCCVSSGNLLDFLLPLQLRCALIQLHILLDNVLMLAL